VLFSCTETDDASTPDGRYEYNPLEVGFFREYEVSIKDSSFFTAHDTLYYLKEVVTEQEQTATGDEYVIERFYKASLDADYKDLPDTVWKALITDLYFVNIENNIRYLRLQFPPSLNLQWDGNTQNNKNQQFYTITSLDSPYSLHDSLYFDHTLNVMQQEKRTVIDTNIAYEVYAEDIGLIERSIHTSLYDISEITLTFASSYTFSQKLISSGNIDSL